MTLPRYNQLQRFWTKWPPMQVLLAHYVGYKPAPAQEVDESTGEASEEMDDESMAALIEMFGPLPPRRQKGTEDGEG